MTKASPGRIARKGKAASNCRNLSPQEIIQLQEMNRIVYSETFKAAQIKGNTALVPRGQEVAAEIEATARLLENVKNNWLTQTLENCGYPKGTLCDINLATGAVTLSKK